MAFIIEHGKTYKSTICSNCGAKIGYTNKDITYQTVMDINWIETYIDVIRCPECSQYTEVHKIMNLVARGLTPTKEEMEKYGDD